MKMKVMFVAVALAVFAVPAQGVIVGPYRLAFITSTNTGCQYTDIADYNAQMQALADAAGIGGDVDWFVIGSTSLVDARDNTGTNPLVETGVPIYLVDGITKVADDNADLWDGDVDHIIDQDEYGNAKTSWPHTGTYLDGTVSDPSSTEYLTYGGGLDDPSQIAQGNGGAVDQWIWRISTQRPPSQELPLYAMSEVIPEPATICLLGLGGLALLRRRRNG